MSVATASRRKKQTAKQTQKSPARAEKPTARTVEQVIRDLTAAKNHRGEIPGYDHDRIAKADARIEELYSELDAVNLAAMPAPDPLALKTKDADVAIGKVSYSGNHREYNEQPGEMSRLARSLATVRLQQRIGVRDAGGGKFELIFGSRRLAAAEMNDWKTIPAKVYPADTTPAQVELLRDIENFNRKDLTPVERAIAVARTIDTVEKAATAKTDEGRKLIQAVEAAGGREAYVGLLLGYPASWVRDHAYVSRLGGTARELLAARRITIEQARELAKLGDKVRADDIAEWAAKNPDGTGGENLKFVQDKVTEELRSLKSVPWRLDVVVKGSGSLPVKCETCQFNTKSDPTLFEHDSNGDGSILSVAAGVCRNGACFQARQRIATVDIEKAVKKAREAIRKGDDEPIPLTEKGLVEFTPAAIRGSTFARKVKSVVEKGGAANGKAGRRSESQQVQKTPGEKAREKFEQAQDAWHRGAWHRGTRMKVIKAINENPLTRALFSVLSDTEALGCFKLNGYYPTPAHEAKALDAARKIANQEKTLALWKSLASPKLSDFEFVGSKVRGLDQWAMQGLIPEALAGMANALGVKLDTEPAWEQFAPKSPLTDQQALIKQLTEKLGKNRAHQKNAKGKKLEGLRREEAKLCKQKETAEQKLAELQQSAAAPPEAKPAEDVADDDAGDGVDGADLDDVEDDDEE
jgi:ParB-like chromosome segregation protein Spo0J